MLKEKSLRVFVVIVLLIQMLFIDRLLPKSYAETTCQGLFQSVSLPLTDLGTQEYIRMNGTATGMTGGLYPDGLNTRPEGHEADGITASAAIKRLNANGVPDSENGRIVMITLGMSNTDQESKAFIDLVRADRKANQTSINPNLLVIDGARPGQSAEKWVDPNGENWNLLNQKLTDIRYGGEPGITSEQVQVAWVKQAHPMLNRTTVFPDHVLDLQSDLEQIVRNLKTKYPNLQIIYTSSRTRSYGYWDGTSPTWELLSPEPAAFETGFAVKWMIEKQINGDPSLNFDPAVGEIVAPFLSWGPYIWVNESPRADGFEWAQADLEHDCTHPSTSGEIKVAEALTYFFKTDTTAVNWFTEGADIQPPTPTPNPTATAFPPSPTPTSSSGRVTRTPIPPTATAILPTATPLPPTATLLPPTATVQPPPATPTTAASTTIHVGNIDGSSSPVGSRWQAFTTITVHDANEQPQSGVTAEGVWAYGSRTVADSCTTDTTGSCTWSLENIPSFVIDVSFAVENLMAVDPYAPTDNHDPDGSSDGTLIVITQ